MNLESLCCSLSKHVKGACAFVKSSIVSDCERESKVFSENITINIPNNLAGTIYTYPQTGLQYSLRGKIADLAIENHCLKLQNRRARWLVGLASKGIIAFGYSYYLWQHDPIKVVLTLPVGYCAEKVVLYVTDTIFMNLRIPVEKKVQNSCLNVRDSRSYPYSSENRVQKG